MIWLLTRPVVWPVKAGAFGTRAGYRTGRLLGYKRLVFVGIGIGIGMLLAPMTGRELRELLRERFASPSPIPLPAGSPGPLPVTTDETIDLTQAPS